MEEKNLKTREMILEEMDGLATACALIERQIATAKANVYQIGVYADPKWFTDARMALKIKNQQRQKLQVALAEINRKEKRAASALFEQNFIDVAKSVLDRETFHGICVTAHKLSGRQP